MVSKLNLVNFYTKIREPYCILFISLSYSGAYDLIIDFIIDTIKKTLCHIDLIKKTVSVVRMTTFIRPRCNNAVDIRDK